MQHCTLFAVQSNVLYRLIRGFLRAKARTTNVVKMTVVTTSKKQPISPSPSSENAKKNSQRHDPDTASVSPPNHWEKVVVKLRDSQFPQLHKA